MATAASAVSAARTRQYMPARNSMAKPAPNTRMAVPRSGCLAMSATGTRVTMNASASCRRFGGSGTRAKYQASIIGKASFMISEGWKLETPAHSHLREQRREVRRTRAVHHQQADAGEREQCIEQRDVDVPAL